MSALVAMLDGTALRAPAPGWFHRTVLADHLVVPGDTLGELEILGRRIPIIAPQIRGIVELEHTDHADVRSATAVQYGDVLFRLADASIRLGDTRAATSNPANPESGQGTWGLVFRAPTSGRFYGRASPDKPAFVSTGSELATGATVCLLEVMKTFHRVTFGGPGMPPRARVRAVLASEGTDVNAGDALLALDALST